MRPESKKEAEMARVPKRVTRAVERERRKSEEEGEI